MILDAFSGAGGWDIAARSLGMDPVGIELDASACALRAATGLLTIRADVSTYPLDHLPRVTGLIASPPCQDWSAAGKRAGLTGKGGPLVYEPLRWARALRPEWIACEQVREVLPIWRQIAEELRTMGYSTWCGVLDTAHYGSPQHRRRAILMASRVREVQPPSPTHGKDGSEDLWGYGVKPLVSMADALGWGLTERPSGTVMARGAGGGVRGLDGGSGSRRMYRREIDAGRWLVETNNDSRQAGGRKQRYQRALDRPAPTVTSGSWVLRTPSWCWERPATTVQGTPRIAPPGHHERQFRDSIPVELWELGVLQDFPRDHPWEAAGTKEAQSRCVGNAIPVRLGTAILGALVGVAREAVA